MLFSTYINILFILQLVTWNVYLIVNLQAKWEGTSIYKLLNTNNIFSFRIIKKINIELLIILCGAVYTGELMRR